MNKLTVEIQHLRLLFNKFLNLMGLKWCVSSAILFELIVERRFGWYFRICMLRFDMFLQSIVPAIRHRAMCTFIRFQSGMGDHMLSRRFTGEERSIAFLALQTRENDKWISTSQLSHVAASNSPYSFFLSHECCACASACYCSFGIQLCTIDMHTVGCRCVCDHEFSNYSSYSLDTDSVGTQMTFRPNATVDACEGRRLFWILCRTSTNTKNKIEMNSIENCVQTIHLTNVRSFTGMYAHVNGQRMLCFEQFMTKLALIVSFWFVWLLLRSLFIDLYLECIHVGRLAFLGVFGDHLNAAKKNWFKNGKHKSQSTTLTWYTTKNHRQ